MVSGGNRAKIKVHAINGTKKGVEHVINFLKTFSVCLFELDVLSGSYGPKDKRSQ